MERRDKEYYNPLDLKVYNLSQDGVYPDNESKGNKAVSKSQLSSTENV